MFDNLITSSSKEAELMVLSKMITTKRIRPELFDGLFTGQERLVFVMAEEQFKDHGTVEASLIMNKYPDAMRSVLNVQGVQNDVLLTELKNHWMTRELGNALLTVGDCENIESTISDLQSRLGRITLSSSEGYYDQALIVTELIKRIEDGYKGDKNHNGYNTGITEFDRATGGIIKPYLYVVGALKKTGKSRLGVYLSMRLIKQGAGVLWESLEMPPALLNQCALAYMSGVNASRIGKKITSEELIMLSTNYGPLTEINWLIYKDYYVENIRSRILIERARGKKVDVIIIDYLQILRVKGKFNKKSDEISELSTSIATMCRDLNVACILFCQMSGEAERVDKGVIPDMRYLKESQAPAEAADVIINVHNFKRFESPYSPEGGYIKQDIHFLIVQRYAASGIQFRAWADLRTCEFQNHPDPYGRSE